jgi:hypothetical protein
VTIAPEKDSTVTFINVFTVTQANQQRLIDLLTHATDGFVNRAPGFISAMLNSRASRLCWLRLAHCHPANARRPAPVMRTQVTSI